MRSSALYLGRVRHRRMTGPEHGFAYPVWYLYLDLDELPRLHREVGFFSHNRFNLTSFDDRDHMKPTRANVRSKLDSWLREQGVTTDIGSVGLLTHARILGHVFNPVSFFFVRDTADRMRHVVAEVNNTFGETCCYLLQVDGETVKHEEDKRFHVSPFQPVDGRYRFRITEPRETLTAHIDVIRDGGRAFDSTLILQRREMSSGSLLRTVARHPHTGLWTLGLIHYQALRLWLKKAPFHRKPSLPAEAWRTRHG
ncbi:MAG: DUF1365 domain-containing protein [Thermoanaerobaculales bacterium]|jgi:DUF1365 family protein|nr:DUF1365 domain-containing protein [Thermoanaerobaculales bacterium]